MPKPENKNIKFVVDLGDIAGAIAVCIVFLGFINCEMTETKYEHELKLEQIKLEQIKEQQIKEQKAKDGF